MDNRIKCGDKLQRLDFWRGANKKKVTDRDACTHRATGEARIIPSGTGSWKKKQKQAKNQREACFLLVFCLFFFFAPAAGRPVSGLLSTLFAQAKILVD